MEIIAQIQRTERKRQHDIWMLKILLLCLPVSENTNKLTFVETMNEALHHQMMKYQLSSEVTLYNRIVNDYDTVTNLLEELKEDIFPNFKLASIVVIDNMKEEELIHFYEKVKELLASFTSLTKACDYIYYHSGKELSEFIVDMRSYAIQYAPTTIQKLLPLDYLANKEIIITLYFKEWVDIFKNIQLTMKYIANPKQKAFMKLKSRFDQLVVYYFIIMTGATVTAN